MSDTQGPVNDAVPPGMTVAASPLQALTAPASALQQRALGETQMRVMLARQFPRLRQDCMRALQEECQRPSLAEDYAYRYPRGGQTVTGPNINLLETIAQCWGHMDYGWEVLQRVGDMSHVRVWAWDMQTNTKTERTVAVRHWRDKESDKRDDPHPSGYPLKSERDIYEAVANQAQRRVRACLEQVIPGQVIDSAMEECQKTAIAKVDASPEGIKKALAGMARFGVNQADIERRYHVKLDASSPAGDLAYVLIQLRHAFASLRDGMATREELFPRNGVPETPPTPPVMKPPPEPPLGGRTGTQAEKKAAKPPPRPEAVQRPPEDAGEVFEYYLFDAQGEPLEDMLFTDVRRWTAAFHELCRRTPGQSIAAILEHNADALLAAGIRPVQAEPPVALNVIEIPLGRDGQPSWPQFLRDHTSALATLTEDTFAAFYNLQQPVIVRAPMSTRGVVLKRYAERAKELGVSIAAPKPVPTIPPDNGKGAPVIDGTPEEPPIEEPRDDDPALRIPQKTIVVPPPPRADPATDNDIIRAENLIDTMRGAQRLGDLEAFFNGTLCATLLRRWEGDRPELIAKVREYFGTRRAELGGT